MKELAIGTVLALGMALPALGAGPEAYAEITYQSGLSRDGGITALIVQVRSKAAEPIDVRVQCDFYNGRTPVAATGDIISRVASGDVGVGTVRVTEIADTAKCRILRVHRSN